jgi:hypothetical protein
VVEVYKDAGINGAKGRDQRPGLDTVLKEAGRPGLVGKLARYGIP